MDWTLKLEGIYEIVYNHQEGQKKREYWCDELFKDLSKKCLQIGISSLVNHKIGPNWDSMDKYDTRSCIDFNYDLCIWDELKHLENKYDIIQCNAILEHVKRPFHAASNMFKMLKNDGILYCEVPFVQPYHPNSNWQNGDSLLDNGVDGSNIDTIKKPHGGDYWRFTPQGIVELFHGSLKILDLFLAGQGGIVFVGKKQGGSYNV
jgi:hypothetical protein